MANVVDDILTLARTESLPTVFTRVDLSEAIGEVVDSVVDLAARNQVRLVDGGVADLTVAGDARQLTSALRNIFENAITYTGAKGEPGEVTYSCVPEGEFAVVEVQDSGIGIPAKYTDRVFERFFRVDQARSRTSGGTGLGLSIVRNVARAHGGTVDIDSQVGVGTTVRMRLPVSDAETP